MRTCGEIQFQRQKLSDICVNDGINLGRRFGLKAHGARISQVFEIIIDKIARFVYHAKAHCQRI